MCKDKNFQPNNQLLEYFVIKERNIDSYKGVPRKELEDVLGKRSILPPKPIKFKSIHKLATINQKLLIKIDKFENVYKDHKTKRITGSSNDNYIGYKK